MTNTATTLTTLTKLRPQYWQLGWRQLRREWRSGELLLISTALILAIAIATSIALFSDRLQQAMQQQADQWLGADQRYTSSQPIPDNWIQQATSADLTQARTVSFASMLSFEQQLVLGAVKAVDQGYPMDAEVRISANMVAAQDNIDQLVNQGPSIGEAWAEPRLLAQLGAQVGDVITLGSRTLTLTAVITRETDRGGNIYSLSPRLMVHWQDVIDQTLLGPGSRAQYRLLVNGDEQALETFYQALVEDDQLGPQAKRERLSENNQAMAEALEKAKQYLGLAAILAVVLAAIAIAIASQRYSERHYDLAALLRTMGLTSHQVLNLFIVQLVSLGMVTTIVALLLAAVLQQGLIVLLADLLPQPMPSAGFTAWLTGASTGLISLLGFAVPQILPLGRVAPLRVLRRELIPVPASSLVLLVMAITSLALLLSLLTEDPLLSVGLIIGGCIVVALLLAAIMLLLKGLTKLLPLQQLPLIWRFAWQHWHRSPRLSAAQLLAIATTLMVMVIIANVRNDLLANWQSSLPADAPNLFAINIAESELPELKQDFRQANLTYNHFYPVVPARLIEINQQPVEQLDIAADRALQRDLILAQHNDLPDNNRVLDGEWLGDQQTMAVSVEQQIADRLKIGMGDTLTFSANGINVQVTVTSLRSVDWANMAPNFYMMLSADAMAEWPQTYLTSVHIPANQQSLIIDWMQRYPAVTLFDTRHLIDQIQLVIERVTVAIECVLAAVLFAALLVTLAIVVAAAPQRLQEAAVLKVLGARSNQIRQGQWLEFGLLGVIAAVLALIGSEALQWWLYQDVLKLAYTGNGWLWFILPPVSALLLVLTGGVVVSRSTQIPPQQLLRLLS